MFVLTCARGNNATNENSYRKYFLPRLKIKNYNIEIDGRNFQDQSINDLIKQYDEVRKISRGQGDDYTTGCLLDFAYFETNYRLIAADLSKEKALDADSRAIQQIIFTGKTDNTIRVYYIFEQSKETILKFSKEKSDTQLEKVKTAVKDKTGTILRMSFKMFAENNLPHQLLLTTRQKTKLRNPFKNNMSTDSKFF